LATHHRATERYLSYRITCHQTQVNAPRLNANLFNYPGEMESWVDLGVGYIPRYTKASLHE